MKDISIRKQKAEALYDEFIFYELDEISKVVSTEIPSRMLLRIINKLRRLRGESNIIGNPYKKVEPDGGS